MTSKSKTTKKKATTKVFEDWSIEERVYRVRSRLRFVSVLLDSENQGVDIDDKWMIDGIERLVNDCLGEVDYITNAPADVLNWSPSKGGGR